MSSSSERTVGQNKIFVDDLNRIRLANPELFDGSNNLKTESEQFVEKLNNFKAIIDDVRKAVEKMGKVADEERYRAVSVQNELRRQEADIDNGNSEENQRLSILVQEKQIKLEQLKAELQSYRNIQAQQLDYMQQLKTSFSNL